MINALKKQTQSYVQSLPLKLLKKLILGFNKIQAGTIHILFLMLNQAILILKIMNNIKNYLTKIIKCSQVQSFLHIIIKTIFQIKKNKKMKKIFYRKKIYAKPDASILVHPQNHTNQILNYFLNLQLKKEFTTKFLILHRNIWNRVSLRVK